MPTPTPTIPDHEGYDEVVDSVFVVAVGVVEAILATASCAFSIARVTSAINCFQVPEDEIKQLVDYAAASRPRRQRERGKAIKFLRWVECATCAVAHDDAL